MPNLINLFTGNNSQANIMQYINVKAQLQSAHQGSLNVSEGIKKCRLSLKQSENDTIVLEQWWKGFV